MRHGGGDWFLWLVVVIGWVWVVACCYLPVAGGQRMALGGWWFKERDTEEEKQRVGGEERGRDELEFVVLF